MIHASLRSRAWRATSIAVVLLLAAGSTTISASQGTPTADLRLLVTRPEGEDDGIWWARIAGNGKIAFVWTRDDLVAGLVATDRYRLFAVDIATGGVRLVSDEGRFKPEAVSADGSFLVGSYELSSNQSTAAVVDSTTGTIYSLDAGEPLTYMSEATISADGTTLAFSATTGLGDTLTPSRMFVADVASGLVTEPLAGADGDLFDLYLNADGTVLAFGSQAENLDLPTGGRGSNPVIYDRVHATLEYAYATTDGGVPDGQSAVDGISADGTTVLIRSGASNLPGAETAESSNTLRPFLYDRSTGTMTSIPTANLGAGPLYVAAHSADLSVLAMWSDMTSTAIRYDVNEGTATPLYGSRVVPDGQLWTGDLDPISLDDSGEIAILLSEARNLGPDEDEFTDAFIVGAPAPDPAAEPYVPPQVPLPLSVLTPDTISPPQIQPPPSEVPASTTPPPTTPIPAAEPSSPPPPAPPPDEDQLRSNPLLWVGCRFDEAFALGVLPCRRPATPAEQLLAAIVISIASQRP